MHANSGDPENAGTALGRAVAAVPAERFHGADGRAVRPCTPAEVTHRHLAVLDVPPGANVLDIGLGSGLSAALLARLAGEEGQVTAVEIHPGLARRAKALYAAHGDRVSVVVGDGLAGHAPRAPYDRILAGTTPPAVPDAWLRQLRPGGVLLSGVRVGDLPNGYAIARITAGAGEEPHRAEVFHGGYMPMIAPERREDVTHVDAPDGSGRSATVLGSCDPSDAAAFLTALTGGRHTAATPVEGAGWYHLKNWLLAVRPEGLLEATLERGNGIGLGVLTPDGTAHAALVTGAHLFADDSGSPALDALTGLVRRWKESGAPRTHELGAELESGPGPEPGPDDGRETPAGADGAGGWWHVRLRTAR
ncbi:methyltransferase domain-containing protein [Streptomyces nanshensis]|uniref:methyltransferase domain-containing protein n=1 Tax=Streptomyces nanshensis TaxID=518642 RepID=UPI00085BE826|nr:methyltransferase domain-containing protein [Streptomyces nanshensis]